MSRFSTWLEDYGVKGGPAPGLFDFPEMWKLNADRFPGFNWVALPGYIITLPYFVTFTSLCFAEAVIRFPTRASGPAPTRPDRRNIPAACR